MLYHILQRIAWLPIITFEGLFLSLLFGIVYFSIIAPYLLIMLTIVFIKKDMSIGNFTWGGGVMLLTLYIFFTRATFLPRQILITALTLIWGIRLAYYIYRRYPSPSKLPQASIPGADPRFIAWEDSWVQKIHQISFIGEFFKNFLGSSGTRLLICASWIFGAQLALLCLMAMPSVIVNESMVAGLTKLDFLGAVLWIIGFIVETVSDSQLDAFRKNPANKDTILQTGLWNYSRHPNYFGEITMWWGFFLIASSEKYLGMYAIVSPITITILLRYVTGVPWIEKTFDNNPAYQEYKRRTNAIIPWWPKEKIS